MIKNDLHRVLIRMMAGALAVWLAAPALAVSARLEVRVSEPFEIGGQMFPSGTVSIRRLQEFTPSSTLNEVWVGRTCLGVMLARESAPSGARASRDSLLFVRHAAGHLVLVGFATKGSLGSDLYRLERVPAGRRWMSADPGAGGEFVAQRPR